MKTFPIGCLSLTVLCIGLHAGSLEETQFKQYVELTKKCPDNPEGMTVCADNTYRIIYAAMPIPLNTSSVTTELKEKMKAEMLKAMRKSENDRKIIKDLKIHLVYTFITSDKKVFSIEFSYQDL